MVQHRFVALFAALVAVLACAIATSAAFAQHTDFPVWDGLGAAACDENFPAVAYNEDLDQFLVVFQRDNGTLGDWDLSAVRVSSTGSSIGAPFTVSSHADGARDVDVAWGQTDPDTSAWGQFLVVWTGYAQPWFVRGRRVDGQLYSALGSNIGVSTSGDYIYDAAVVYAPDYREWWVVWDEYQNPGPTFVRGQRVLPDGQTPGSRSNHRVSVDPIGYPPSAHQINPALAYGPSTGDALVVWADTGHYTEPTAGGWGLWGRHWVAAIFADGVEDGDFRQWSAAVE